MTFLQLSDHVDDDAWFFHLHRGDYSRWFQTVIKDEELAAPAREIERDTQGNVSEDRSVLKRGIESRYTASA